MARLNRRQRKKLNKKRESAFVNLLREEIRKEIDKEIIEMLTKAR